MQQVQILGKPCLREAHQQARPALKNPLTVGGTEDQREEPLEQKLPSQLPEGLSAGLGFALQPVLQRPPEGIRAGVVG